MLDFWEKSFGSYHQAARKDIFLSKARFDDFHGISR
jgi:hypothetical protein